ncbi:hypothetical protein JKF63_01318 [Porcisia hertigi]|uniref:Protein kinase domain-containing protein n=1 Tax=Porcisia hertigi TaxID=2761500 RepID=A0A836I3H0_9TRYP|nr:hypothetical protein JKF63_01318 [Porcisia hertigi]
MLTTNFTLMLGILLAFVVMGGGSGAALYAGLYRRAIRHHLRAFALCVRLADAWSSPDVHHLAGEGATPIGATVPGAQRSANGNNSPYKLSPFVTRWHEEVSRLVNHLTCPIEVSQAEWCSFLASERRSIVWPHENGNASFDRSATATALDGDVCCNTNRFLPSDGQSSGPAAENEALSPLGTQPGSRYRMNEAFFSRRPQHPVAVSKRQEAVTVVVCRLIDPMGLLTDQSPLTRAQLEELQRLSNDFHQRLRAVPRTPYAAITEVGVSEVVFSFNTVSPLPSLVASPAAMALALAAHKALVEWRPTYLGTPLQWGIAVHRFDAYMCPTRGMPGRLYISFGTVEYDFARLLAELAALFDHGVLCHAGFLADASCESQSLPVDYVMDLRQQAFLVYQLHDSDVDKEHRQQMNSAIVAMRNGEYKAAADALDVWMKRSDGCGGLPRAAARLRYVASFLERAVRQRQPHASEGHVTSGNSPSFLPATQGVAEWAVEGLRMSYSRPPPVWEEEEAPVPITPQLLSPDVRSTSSIMTTGKGGSRRLRARQCQSSHVLVPPLAIKSRGDTAERAAFLRGSPHRSSSFRTPHISPVQQVEEPLQPRELDTLLYHPRQGSVAVEEDSGLLLSSQRRDRQLSFASEFVPRGGNVLDARSPPSLSPHNIGGGGGSYSPPATRPVFEMPTPTAALHDKSGDRMWAALTLLTESDQSTLTTTAPRPRLCSNSWSFAESGVPEMPTLTPMHSATWLPSHLDMRWQRHASILLPALKTDEGAQSAAAPTCAPQRGNGAARSSQRGRHDIGYGESGRPLCGDDTLPAADLQTGDGKWPPQLLGPRVDSESSNTTIALLPLEVSHESALACSDSARRHTPASTAVAVSSILPLFPEIRIPFTAPERPEARSEADVFSEADVTQEPSMMSVVQRSRSRLSQRATAQLSNVVCSRTNRIGSSSSDAVIVFQGFHPDGYLVAVKRVSRPAERQIALLRNEVEILRELHHRNIVNIVSTWNDDEAEYMAMEYACETLASVLQKFKVLLSGVVRFYTRELLNALVYLHRDCGVIHRDLSPNNVIITSTTDRSRVKLIDFGHSVMIPHFCGGSSALSATVPGSVSLEFTERRLSHSTVSVTDVVMPVVGTPLFMSPQACQGLVHPANDVWSLGIIVHLCLTGTYPYPSGTLTDPETFIANVGSGRLTPVLVDSCEMTEEARSFIEQCFTLDHTDRPLAAALLKHSFVEQ